MVRWAWILFAGAGSARDLEDMSLGRVARCQTDGGVGALPRPFRRSGPLRVMLQGVADAPRRRPVLWTVRLWLCAAVCVWFGVLVAGVGFEPTTFRL